MVWKACCCLSYKDTILKANHSRNPVLLSQAGAVAYPTKILFWKRITAHTLLRRWWRQLLLILQRYYFESESQQRDQSRENSRSCCLSYKDTILKANHSGYRVPYVGSTAVAYPTKILFWKRITAACAVTSCGLPLLLILQRYYFESESQLIMKQLDIMEAVAYPTKILFWKRITA